MDWKGRRPQSPIPTRLPKSIQKVIPVVLACIFLLLLLPKDALQTSETRIVPRVIEFPRKIWQLWKVDVLSLDARDLPRAKSWVYLNSGLRYEVLTDDNDQYYVETMYGPDRLNRPDIVDMYRTIKAKIVKADILRYLVMYAEGGVYTVSSTGHESVNFTN
jgi:mannosyltransferase OCH1-like enzyme